MCRNYAGCKYTFVLTYNIPLTLVLTETASSGFMIQITGERLLLLVPVRALLWLQQGLSFPFFVSREREAIQVTLSNIFIINTHKGHCYFKLVHIFF